jgi:hypothetical protein
MKNKINIFIMYSTFAILASSCDQKNAVMAVKNQTRREIIGAGLVDDSLADSDLVKEQLPMNIYVHPGKFQDVGIFDFRFGDKNDTSKLYLYIFNEDTLNKYRGLNMRKGILEKSLIKKLVIQLSTVKSLDTLYVR